MSNENETHTFTIVVNARTKTWSEKEITFEQVVQLAFDTPPNSAETIFTVTYRKGGNEHRPEGVMVAGDSVKVKEGTIFNVTTTSRS